MVDRNIQNWIIIGIFSLIGLGILVGLIVAASKANWKRLLLFGGLLLVATFVILGANFFPFWMLLVLAILLVLLMGIALLNALVGQGSLLGNWIATVSTTIAQSWNPRKMYSGTIFGDLANSLGVIAGMGASRIFVADVWWWIGHVAALFAFAVGLSLLWRSFDETPNVMESHKKKIIGLFNLIVGAATWLSLMLITTGNATLVRRLDIRILWLVLFGIVFVILIGITVKFQIVDRPLVSAKKARTNGLVVAAYWLVIVAVLTIAIILVVDVNLIVSSRATDVAGPVVGIFGILFWIGAELESWISSTRKINEQGINGASVLDYLIWEKNSWEILGGLTTIIFLSAVVADAANGTEAAKGLQSTELYRIIFFIGAIMALFGTLRGILSGILNRHTPVGRGRAVTL